VWIATATGFDGDRHRTPVLQLSGEPPSSRSSLALIRSGRRELPQGAIREGLARYLEAEADDQGDQVSIARYPVQDVYRSAEGVITEELLGNEPLLSAIRRTSHLPTIV
jgi:hypothetical protein